jgi:hypothetical protein
LIVMKKYLLIVFSATAFSLNAQNVGIGNNNPQYKLDVTGDVSLTGKIRLNGAATANKVLKTDGNGDPIWGDDNNTTYSAGTGLTLSGTAFNLSNIGTAGTYRSVTVDAQGRITAGTNPTTLSGYGITDATPSNRSITIAGTANRVTVTGGTQDLSSNRTWTLSAPQDIHTGAAPTFWSGIYNTTNAAALSISPFIRLTNATTGSTASDGLIVGVEGTGDAWITNKEARSIKFGTNDTSRMEISSNGHLLPNATNTYDLGSSTLRFKDGYFSGTVTGNVTGNITGNASTATTLQNARTINGVSFNGSANITVTANTPQTLTRGTYLTGNNFNGSAATTWAVDATTTNTASKVVARDASGDIFFRYAFSSYLNMSHAAAARTTDNIFYSSTDDYIRKNTAAGFRTSLGLGNSSTLNVGTTAGTVAAGDHPHANATTTTDGFMAAADKAKIDVIAPRKGSFVITKVNDGWHVITHNWNIGNVNWYAVATNGDRAANNSVITYDLLWRDNNSCFVHLTGPNGGIRINIIAF